MTFRRWMAISWAEVCFLGLYLSYPVADSSLIAYPMLNQVLPGIDIDYVAPLERLISFKSQRFTIGQTRAFRSVCSGNED
jgi:hypothetical protein